MAGTDSGTGALGKYRLIAELGHGGMAEVYLALASGPAGFNKLVVIKQIRQQFAEDPEFLTMFLDEARLAARLNHPNVVQTNEVGEDGGRYFIAMEYLEGQPLNRVLNRLGKDKSDALTLPMQLTVLVETLAGLHHAHELCDFDGTPLSVVHRDMSPHNIFVTYAGQVKIVDFGIAKALSSSSETRTGVLKGKIGYMAPEQAMGERVDRRADIFSVGMILWEMITGKRMFKGLPDVAALQRIVNGDLPSPRTIIPGLSDRLEAVCLKALARDRDQRYATAAELASDLEDVVHDLGVRGSPRDVGRLISTAFEGERARIKQLVEASHAGARVAEDAASEAKRTGSWSKPRLPVIEAPATESVSMVKTGAVVTAPTAPPEPVEPPSGATGVNRPSPSSLTANTTTAASPVAAPAPPSRAPLYAGGALLLGAVAAVALLLSRGGDAPRPAVAVTSSSAAPTATAEVARTMRIESSPTGATVSEGSITLGKTPLEVVLDPSAGVRKLVVSLEGYAPYTVEQGPAKENVRVVVPLAPAAAKTADPTPAKATPPPPRPPPPTTAAPRPPAPDINMQR